MAEHRPWYGGCGRSAERVDWIVPVRDPVTVTWHSMLFNAALLSCLCYAWLHGGASERLAVSTAAAASIATALGYTLWHRRFRQVEGAVLIVDLLTLAAFVWLALRSTRYWPLCVAGLQAAGIAIHLAKAAVPIGRFAYAVGMAFWGDAVLAAIAVGTWRHRRRRIGSGAR